MEIKEKKDIKQLLTEIRGYLPETFDSQRPIAKLVSEITQIEKRGYLPTQKKHIDRYLDQLEDKIFEHRARRAYPLLSDLKKGFRRMGGE